MAVFRDARDRTVSNCSQVFVFDCNWIHISWTPKRAMLEVFKLVGSPETEKSVVRYESSRNSFGLTSFTNASNDTRGPVVARNDMDFATGKDAWTLKVVEDNRYVPETCASHEVGPDTVYSSARPSGCVIVRVSTVTVVSDVSRKAAVALRKDKRPPLRSKRAVTLMLDMLDAGVHVAAPNTGANTPEKSPRAAMASKTSALLPSWIAFWSWKGCQVNYHGKKKSLAQTWKINNKRRHMVTVCAFAIELKTHKKNFKFFIG